MNIFAVIVTYNALHNHWIDRCMRSLQSSSIPVKTIIIDNCSTDGTQDYVPKHFPEVIWLPQENNLGFGQANNVGIRYALKQQADYVLLLNQDASISCNAIEQMLSISDGNSLLSPLHLNGDGTSIDELFRETLKPKPQQMQDDLLIKHTLANSYEVGEVCAACWLMPISLIEKIGGFNPIFYHYGEDNNYYHRLKYHHVKVLLMPHAYMYHDRLLYGNKIAYDRKRVKRELTLIACNINFNWRQRMVNYARLLFNYYAREWPRHTYTPGSFFTGIIWLSVHYRTIHDSRKREKTEGENWL